MGANLAHSFLDGEIPPPPQKKQKKTNKYNIYYILSDHSKSTADKQLLNAEAIELARQRRLKEMKLMSVIREVCMYAFFLMLLVVISYSFRSPDAGEMRQHIYKEFNGTYFNQVSRSLL